MHIGFLSLIVIVIPFIVLVCFWLMRWMGSEDKTDSIERKRIMEMVENGKITLDESKELLDSLGRSSALRGEEKFSRADIVMLVAVSMVILGFFLPWAHIRLPQVAGMFGQSGSAFQAGYHAGFCGKWMVDSMPWNAGFDEGVVQVNWYRYWGPHLVVFNSGGYLKEWNLTEPLPREMEDHSLPINGPQPRAEHFDSEYGPRMLNRFAIDYIERHQDEPFFLYYPMKLPHVQIMPTPDSVSI